MNGLRTTTAEVRSLGVSISSSVPGFVCSIGTIA
jgi:hypothetical protein